MAFKRPTGGVETPADIELALTQPEVKRCEEIINNFINLLTTLKFKNKVLEEKEFEEWQKLFDSSPRLEILKEKLQHHLGRRYEKTLFSRSRHDQLLNDLNWKTIDFNYIVSEKLMLRLVEYNDYNIYQEKVNLLKQSSATFRNIKSGKPIKRKDLLPLNELFSSYNSQTLWRFQLIVSKECNVEIHNSKPQIFSALNLFAPQLPFDLTNIITDYHGDNTDLQNYFIQYELDEAKNLEKVKEYREAKDQRDLDKASIVTSATQLLMSFGVPESSLAHTKVGPDAPGGDWCLQTQLSDQLKKIDLNTKDYFYFAYPSRGVRSIPVIINVRTKKICYLDPQLNLEHEEKLRTELTSLTTTCLPGFNVFIRNRDFKATCIQPPTDQMNCGIYSAMIIAGSILYESYRDRCPGEMVIDLYQGLGIQDKSEFVDKFTAILLTALEDYVSRIRKDKEFLLSEGIPLTPRIKST